MKTRLKKILLISLFFSAVAPSEMQANSGWITWGSGAIKSALRSGAREAVSFLAKNKIAVEMGIVVGVFFVWKVFKITSNHGLRLGIRYRNIAKVRQALAIGADVNKQNKFGDTALMEAAFMGYPEIVRLLLVNGADVSKQNVLCRTVLMDAAFMGYPEIVELLLANGADVNKQNKFGDTALTEAAGNGHPEIVRLLLATKKVDINQDTCGGTALMIAVEGCHPEIVRLLLATKKVDINQQDEKGWTALMRAELKAENAKGAAIVDQLLAAGADPLVKTKNGTTVLEQSNNETINEYMRKRTSRILKPECELAQ